jgi:hypothetical protein
MGKPLPTNLSAGIVAGAPPLPIVPRSLEEALTMARAVVASGMAPHGLETPEACLIAILHGLEVGLTPLSALQRIAVIDGRPTIWGDGAMALVRASGLCRSVREWIEGDAPQDWTAFCEVLRRGESDPVTCRFAVEDARRAGLWGKPGPWSLYPRRMLQMRARAFALRDVFADVLGGLYLREEIESEVVLQDPAPSKAQAIAAPPVPDRATSPAPGDGQGQPLAETGCETETSQASEASGGAPCPVSKPEDNPGGPKILAGAQHRPRERRSRPRRERQGWVRLRALRDAIRLRAPPPPEYAAGEDPDAPASLNPSQETENAAARMTSPPEAVLQLLEDALACALDEATLSEIQEEFAQRLATLSREDVERAERINARHAERIAACERRLG